jgi:uncharacterized protein (TIGR03437 family)
MFRFRAPVVLLLAAAALSARHDPILCGTSRETPAERLFLHRARKAPRVRPAAVNRDTGNLALIEDSGGIVARQNEFNLEGKTLRFTPAGASYSYTVLETGYDPAAAQGEPLAALDDDDSRRVALPFAFPFFGASYREIYVNSDGNLTFTAGDNASTERSLGRVTAGPPRLAPLFDDLDPSQTAGGVRVLAGADRVVVSWVAVPEWTASGAGTRQTFQAALYPDGRIDFAYGGVTPSSAVVGIAPGALKGGTALVDFRNDASAAYGGAVAERFGNTLDVDMVTVAQRFYDTHDDAYDYLVVFNNMDIPALPGGVVAYEATVRSRGSGYGATPRDDGAQYGSPSRLQAVLNMGPLSQYPADPNAVVPARSQAGDTPVTTIAHETGHLFLAYASITDPDDPTARPMLGYQNQHWAFTFNSEASLLEGERILDQGPAASPRFLTTDTVQQYAPLDQYLMGWRAPSDVPDTFVVRHASATQTWHPARNFAFDGTRQNITAAEVVAAMGRRTPDDTIAQRRFRFAFVLVTANGADPSAADLARLEAYRQEFESFFAKASGGRASAEATLQRSLKLSLFPAAGVVEGAASTATISVEKPPSTALPIALHSANGNAQLPASVTIAAGASSVAFPYSGVKAGVEEVTATPGDPRYETAFARVQVAGAAELRLTQLSADPVAVKLTDANGLVYPGVSIGAVPSAGGAVVPASALTDAEGVATFRWSTGGAAVNQLRLTVDTVPAAALTVRAGSAVPSIGAVVNAASGAAGFAPGSIATIYGARLAGAHVAVGGAAAMVFYASDSQINFLAPATLATGSAPLTVTAPSDESASAQVDVVAVQPGIFGAAVTGGYLVVYATGLGRVPPPVTVFIGATPVQPAYSGASAEFPGLYQLNVPIPAGISGVQSVLLSAALAHSNTIRVTIP